MAFEYARLRLQYRLEELKHRLLELDTLIDAESLVAEAKSTVRKLHKQPSIPLSVKINSSIVQLFAEGAQFVSALSRSLLILRSQRSMGITVRTAMTQAQLLTIAGDAEAAKEIARSVLPKAEAMGYRYQGKTAQDFIGGVSLFRTTAERMRAGMVQDKDLQIVQQEDAPCATPPPFCGRLWRYPRSGSRYCTGTGWLSEKSRVRGSNGAATSSFWKTCCIPKVALPAMPPIRTAAAAVLITDTRWGWAQRKLS